MIEPPIKKNNGGPSWLLTFSDLITLMLVFFVMLFSMSQIVREDWDRVYSIMQSSFQHERAEEIIKPNATFNVSRLAEVKAKNIDYLYKIITDQFQKSNLMLYDYVQKHEDRIIISLPANLLFENNSDELKTSGDNVLESIGDILSRISNQIELIGHADPRPIRSGPYPTNWHLSLARALAIEQRFVMMGYNRPVIVQGVSDAEFDLFDKDLSLLKRQKMARKVDIVIHASRSRK